MWDGEHLPAYLFAVVIVLLIGRSRAHGRKNFWRWCWGTLCLALAGAVGPGGNLGIFLAFR
jgi:hypothetical protein